MALREPYKCARKGNGLHAIFHCLRCASQTLRNHPLLKAEYLFGYSTVVLKANRDGPEGKSRFKFSASDSCLQRPNKDAKIGGTFTFAGAADLVKQIMCLFF